MAEDDLTALEAIWGGSQSPSSSSVSSESNRQSDHRNNEDEEEIDSTNSDSNQPSHDEEHEVKEEADQSSSATTTTTTTAATHEPASPFVAGGSDVGGDGGGNTPWIDPPQNVTTFLQATADIEQLEQWVESHNINALISQLIIDTTDLHSTTTNLFRKHYILKVLAHYWVTQLGSQIDWSNLHLQVGRSLSRINFINTQERWVKAWLYWTRMLAEDPKASSDGVLYKQWIACYRGWQLSGCYRGKVTDWLPASSNNESKHSEWITILESFRNQDIIRERAYHAYVAIYVSSLVDPIFCRNEVTDTRLALQYDITNPDFTRSILLYVTSLATGNGIKKTDQCWAWLTGVLAQVHVVTIDIKLHMKWFQEIPAFDLVRSDQVTEIIEKQSIHRPIVILHAFRAWILLPHSFSIESPVTSIEQEDQHRALHLLGVMNINVAHHQLGWALYGPLACPLQCLSALVYYQKKLDEKTTRNLDTKMVVDDDDQEQQQSEAGLV